MISHPFDYVPEYEKAIIGEVADEGFINWDKTKDVFRFLTKHQCYLTGSLLQNMEGANCKFNDVDLVIYVDAAFDINKFTIEAQKALPLFTIGQPVGGDQFANQNEFIYKTVRFLHGDLQIDLQFMHYRYAVIKITADQFVCRLGLNNRRDKKEFSKYYYELLVQLNFAKTAFFHRT